MNMKSESFKITVILILYLINSWTAFGQICSDCVEITREEQRTCIKCLINEPIKDSIIISKDSIIVIQREFIESSEVYIETLDSRLAESIKDFEKMKKKRKRAFVFGGISTIFAIIITCLVL